MHVEFDRTIPAATIGPTAWSRLGPERWFDKYRILTPHRWDARSTFPLPDVIEAPDCALNDAVNSIPPSYFFLHEPAPALADLPGTGHRFVDLVSSTARSVENKITWRDLVSDLDVKVPPYRVFVRSGMGADAATLRCLLDGREHVIVQHEFSNGGRGTYLVRDIATLKSALDDPYFRSTTRALVVSDVVPGARERSIQSVVTRFGTFVGPLQKQLVGDPVLVGSRGSAHFCGGEISRFDPLLDVEPVARSYAFKIGNRLHEIGYRGVFGLDLLVDQDGGVYVCDLNPRLTGMTTLLTFAHRPARDIPFYLLHLLESARLDYTISTQDSDDIPQTSGMIIVPSRQDNDVRIVDAPPGGLYTFPDASFRATDIRLPDFQDNDCQVVYQLAPPGSVVGHGDRLLIVLTSRTVTDEHDNLLPEQADFVRRLFGKYRFSGT